MSEQEYERIEWHKIKPPRFFGVVHASVAVPLMILAFRWLSDERRFWILVVVVWIAVDLLIRSKRMTLIEYLKHLRLKLRGGKRPIASRRIIQQRESDYRK